ncbi:hypothetical protein KIK06_20925 [Nocardiopsis sp. EMB25]|uniref:hypothetical protein n=1 Tax=Nocardiopsis sp. EMB25 TaxID=2835867 RepID=UPI002283C00A|nr:hypothetical protein [Nocardiopsis sp. EMB25]MCY9786361.1 hypothetical protein [Nocardiopsis sp. EMB25]
MSFLSTLIDEFRPSQIKRDIDDVTRLRTENPKVRRRWASRSRRRAATVLMGAMGLVGAAFLWWQPYTANGGGPGLVLGVVAALAVFVWLVAQLNMATRLAVSYQHLDERQRIERDRSTRIGHHVTAAVLVSAFLLVMVLNVFSYDAVSFPEELTWPLLWLILMVHTSAPSAYLAWTQPDEIVDDEDD